jgi:hypothetical protein
VHNEEITPMALSESARSELLDVLRVGESPDLVGELAQWGAPAADRRRERPRKIDADRYERSAERVGPRNNV